MSKTLHIMIAFSLTFSFLLIACNKMTPEKACSKYAAISKKAGKSVDKKSIETCVKDMVALKNQDPAAWECTAVCTGKALTVNAFEKCGEFCSSKKAPAQAITDDKAKNEINEKYTSLTKDVLVQKVQQRGWTIEAEKEIRGGWRLSLTKPGVVPSDPLAKAIVMLVDMPSPIEAAAIADKLKDPQTSAETGGTNKVLVFKSVVPYSGKTADTERAEILFAN